MTITVYARRGVGRTALLVTDGKETHVAILAILLLLIGAVCGLLMDPGTRPSNAGSNSAEPTNGV